MRFTFAVCYLPERNGYPDSAVLVYRLDLPVTLWFPDGIASGSGKFPGITRRNGIIRVIVNAWTEPVSWAALASIGARAFGKPSIINSFW
jgi:hypothetical protein